jgi:hypothetical protein
VTANEVINASASISAGGPGDGDGTFQDAATASGSLLAPIPVAGPDFRFYLTNSPRLFVEGQVLGMYFFATGTLFPRPMILASPSPNI